MTPTEAYKYFDSKLVDAYLQLDASTGCSEQIIKTINRRIDALNCAKSALEMQIKRSMNET